MKKSYYDAASLERVLVAFETRYSMLSADFYEHHLADDLPETVTGFHRHVWASFYRDAERLRGESDGFVGGAERALQLV